MTDTPSSSPGTASDVDVARAAYQEAVDAWQEVQNRRYFPQWELMANVVVPAQEYIAALLAENERLAAALEGAKGILWYTMGITGGVQAQYDGWKAVRTGDNVEVSEYQQAASQPAREPDTAAGESGEAED